MQTEKLTGPRARTQRLMVETAIELMQDGETPSVSDVSEAAQVSRATAYRYFTSQASLVQTVIDAALGPILDWSPTTEDAHKRLAELFDQTMPRIEEFEATFRAALKLSLEQWVKRRSGTLGEEVEFRRGNRIALLEDATKPLKEKLKPAEYARLVNGLSLVFGIESIVVLKDICGLEADQAHKLAFWAAQAMVAHTLAGSVKKE